MTIKAIETYDDLLTVIKRLHERRIGFIVHYEELGNQFCLNLTETGYSKAVRSFSFLTAKHKPKYGFSYYFKLSGVPDKITPELDQRAIDIYNERQKAKSRRKRPVKKHP